MGFKFKVAVIEAEAKQIRRVARKTKKKWITEDIADLMEKRRQLKIIEKNTAYCIINQEIRKKNVTKPERNRPMASAKTSKYTAEVLSRQCTKTLKKSAHPENVLFLNKKNLWHHLR